MDRDFVSFFPQLVAGPIERSKNLLVQIHGCPGFCFESFKKGILLVVYGLFLKMVIADRAAIIVDTVFADTAAYPGVYIAVAAFFFAIQIYCDFYGYSTVARGFALLMGIHLMDNFAAPYHAHSVKEFWRRWHISLSSWFRDYLYIPLGGSRKGLVRKEWNLFLVFAVSGLWHGASMGFVFWGILHALYQIIPELWKRGRICCWKPWGGSSRAVFRRDTQAERMWLSVCGCCKGDVRFRWFVLHGCFSAQVFLLYRIFSIAHLENQLGTVKNNL